MHALCHNSFVALNLNVVSKNLMPTIYETTNDTGIFVLDFLKFSFCKLHHKSSEYEKQ